MDPSATALLLMSGPRAPAVRASGRLQGTTSAKCTAKYTTVSTAHMRPVGDTQHDTLPVRAVSSVYLPSARTLTLPRSRVDPVGIPPERDIHHRDHHGLIGGLPCFHSCTCRGSQVDSAMELPSRWSLVNGCILQTLRRVGGSRAASDLRSATVANGLTRL